VAEQSLYFAESSEEEGEERKAEEAEAEVELDQAKLEYIRDEIVKVQEAMGLEIDRVEEREEVVKEEI